MSNIFESFQTASAPPMTPTNKSICPPSYEEAVPLSRHAGHRVTSTASDDILPYNATHDIQPHDDESSVPLLQVVVDQNLHQEQTRNSSRTVPYQVQKDTIVSYDQQINEDGLALAQFLHEHNTPPQMKIKFRGYHRATHFKSRTAHDREGNLVIEERKPKTKQVEDFNFEVDCSYYISPTCQGLYGPKNISTGHQKSLDEVCEEYVLKQGRLRELEVTKVVDWNYIELTQALTAAIRSGGYKHNLVVTYEMKESKITIKSGASPFTNIASSTWVYVACITTMLFLIAWPIYRFIEWIYAKFTSRTIVTSTWGMKISEREFYQNHVTEIVGKTNRKQPSNATITFAPQRQ
ncbi:hypothetical protein DFQ28_007619 [Apophysomyces sp. BC1034]|nr:hypothetical protein DFQ30_007444 [Apophysomyces sp. BC1015]KAG0176186.1 hypothetical protein DFQ29_006447 [Apophysomyces sp. BC1021]KAG0186570.1 hypothetical protein DFQ28_007619 [Apophysomyces sp. BC1034]